jgi:hypothetical protein
MNELDPYVHTRYDPLTQHVLNMKEAVQLRESAARLVQESAAMFEEATERTGGRRYSVVRMIDCARFNRRLDGIEGEMSEELARQMGVPHSHAKPFIPWDALGKRVMLATGTDNGLNITACPRRAPSTCCCRSRRACVWARAGDSRPPDRITSGPSRTGGSDGGGETGRAGHGRG